jgi:type IV pilus assembly protein PilV
MEETMEAVMRFRSSHGQQGFSLIELSVATAIYSMGLGSLSLLMLLAVHGTAGARLDTMAYMHAASLAEMIAMNSDAIGHYVYPSEPAMGACDAGSPGNAEQMATWNFMTWRDLVAADLPQGDGLLCRDSTPADGDGTDPACDGGGGPVIKVFWSAPADGGAEPAEVHRKVSRLPLP